MHRKNYRQLWPSAFRISRNFPEVFFILKTEIENSFSKNFSDFKNFSEILFENKTLRRKLFQENFQKFSVLKIHEQNSAGIFSPGNFQLSAISPAQTFNSRAKPARTSHNCCVPAQLRTRL